VTPDGGDVGRLLFSAVLIGALVAGAASAVVVGSHYDQSDYERGASDFRVDTYGASAADQRRPGATDRSYWTESISYGIPEDEKLYLTRTVTYRPVPSDCAAENTEEFGIDRDATYEGERRIDETATESVKSFSQDTDARDRYEAELGEYGDLTTTDWAYVERLQVDWYAPDDFGAPLEIYRGDRFVSAQRDCIDNPDAAGWYRFAAVNEGEFENGTEVRQERPTFSHWFYVCDCASREEAVETLGPPPSEREASTPTPTATSSGDAGANPAAGGETPGDTAAADTSATTAATPIDRPAARTATSTPTATPGAATPTPEPTPTAGWDRRVVETPTAAEGTGFTPAVAVVAVAAVVVALRRR